MKDYISIREAAEQWGVSERRVNQFCAEGRVDGARKFGGAWAIPCHAEKPSDPRRKRQQPAEPAASGAAPNVLLAHPNLMPLMNAAFQPGHCMEYIHSMEDGPQKSIAQAEYCYFSGRPEEAAREVEPFLTSSDMALRLSSCLIYAYANLSLGHIQRARFALSEVELALQTMARRDF